MAPFNWFNRQHSEESTTETETAQVAQPSAEPSVSAEPAAESATQPEVAQDYLTWAKSAYENIRKRQQEETPDQASDAQTSDHQTPTTQTLESTEAAPAEASPVAAGTVAEGIDATPKIESAQVLASETSTDEALTAEAPGEPIASQFPEGVIALQFSEEGITETTPTIGSETSSPLTPEAVAPSPATAFWAQAEADRLARLERLRQEAIEQEEAEAQLEAVPSAVPASTEPVIDPGFVLDEGFLWSAEVLAAQGRRAEDVSLEEITWLKRLRQGLDKTRRSLVNQLRSIVGQGPLNQDAVTEIESLLLQADVGIEATDYIVEALQAKLREEALPPNEAIAYLKQILREMLDRPLQQSHNVNFSPEKDKLNIWLMTGVNGAGKTTTIGKLAHLGTKSGYRCLIAAADTFRAAAVQQVKAWGDRSKVEVVANPGKNTDPAAVVFDAITAAQSRNTELLLVDTAGRLQNKKNLMDELSKIRRIIDKKAPDAHIESLLVLDATLGQNGLRQAEVFSEAAKLSGVVLTKLDGTARGGIALAIVQQLGLPIRFIGAGEGIEDLRPFSSYEFVEALLSG
ncbi:signal recognition particle-docking protein FtsY [Leptolyngbya sp. FACHB-711]|uniref:signal recognition particle-docking protein FtsY n=1 Tax=unclassified Leptolyngbya TaxID=2650499 RepID=UPI0016848B56|nr:signal recognition particle-docking protein FtsY [Leptolyngbya sp. FACHB-711]MBD1850116.1 signal recognition particle-docking protein FtsY [Cyanobacteria bacterium FACHB-502]MBD2023093.1 signal recognition particle-docking protein FtsY [Leptolyngbya sp. FACHB-711]